MHPRRPSGFVPDRDFAIILNEWSVPIGCKRFKRSFPEEPTCRGPCITCCDVAERALGELLESSPAFELVNADEIDLLLELGDAHLCCGLPLAVVASASVRSQLCCCCQILRPLCSNGKQRPTPTRCVGLVDVFWES
mgnify:CR=1 FL=1